MRSRRDRRDYAIHFYDAVEQPDGSWLHNDGAIVWYNEAGQLHREAGPAVILSMKGGVYWCLTGDYFTFDKWLIKLNKSDETKLLLRLQYG
jgi:hypothetical protein